MTTRIPQILTLLLVSLGMAGCQAIADIFQAGVWVGVIIVVAIVALVGFLMSRGKRS